MKKYLFPVTISLLIGISMAYFIIKQYEGMPILAVSSNAETLYYVERGIYSDLENMENNMKDFTDYIYNTENNQYHTYIGITTNKVYALIIQNFFKNLGYDTILVEKITDNKEFINILRQYDELLNKTDDSESIKTISKVTGLRIEDIQNIEIDI